MREHFPFFLLVFYHHPGKNLISMHFRSLCTQAASLSYQWKRGAAWWSLSSSPNRGWGGGEAVGPSPLGVTRSDRHRSSPGRGRSYRCDHGYKDGVLPCCVSEQFLLWAWTWRRQKNPKTKQTKNEHLWLYSSTTTWINSTLWSLPGNLDVVVRRFGHQEFTRDLHFSGLGREIAQEATLLLDQEEFGKLLGLSLQNLNPLLQFGDKVVKLHGAWHTEVKVCLTKWK